MKPKPRPQNVQLDEEKRVEEQLLDGVMDIPDTNIVIAGMSGRYPKSDSIQELEQNLYEKKDLLNDKDSSRFPCGLWGLPPRAGRLKDISKFDAEFFGYSNDQANHIDHQMRIIYETVYEAILDSGVNPASLRGTKTAVFCGACYADFEIEMSKEYEFKTKGYICQIAAGVANYFDLHGFTGTYDGACASGLLAFHEAIQMMDSQGIDQAIVCSTSIPVHPLNNFLFMQMQFLSPAGDSSFMDSKCDGYIKAEGVCALFLQRKDLALRNYGTVISTMINCDGYKPEGITFPSGDRQAELNKAHKIKAGVSTNRIEVVEAHGTGTSAGDIQEVNGLAKVYVPDDGEDKRTIGTLLAGSLKSNMGHAEGSSGLVSLTKIALMLDNETIYPNCNYRSPNPDIKPLMEGKIQPPTKLAKLRSKIVPVSCFGFGGANASVFLRSSDQQAIEDIFMDNNVDFKAPRLVVMFGRSIESLDYFFDKLMSTEERSYRNCLSDDFLMLINSVNAQKIDRLMEYRGYLLVDRANKLEISRDIKRCCLKKLEKPVTDDIGRSSHFQEIELPACNMIMSGFGSHWPSMGSGLENFEPFWSTIEKLAPIVGIHGIDLIGIMKDPIQCHRSMAEDMVAIVAYQVALIDIIKDRLNVRELRNIIGHSIGEVSCAYAAGFISQSEAVLTTYVIGKTIDDLSTRLAGKMVAVGMSNEEMTDFLKGKQCNFPTVKVCCINGPNSVTISGRVDEIEKFCRTLETQVKGASIHPIEGTRVALHNELIMDQDVNKILMNELKKVLHRVADANQIINTRWLSTFKSSACPASPQYFADCLCKKVDFLGAIQKLDEGSIVLELGPAGIFESQFKMLVEKKFNYVKLMRKLSDPMAEQTNYLLESMGRLYQAGASIDLNAFYTKCSDDKKPKTAARKKTPSLGSLIKWNHDQSHFVPKFPAQFSKSSAKTDIPADVHSKQLMYLVDHCIEGRVLYPTTGYLFLAWRAFSFTKRRVWKSSFNQSKNLLMPVEFIDVRLRRAVILGSGTPVLRVQYEAATDRFTITEGGSIVVEGYARTPVENPNGLLYDKVRDEIKDENLTLDLTADDIYKQFRVNGYDYGKNFRNLKGASEDGRYSQVKHEGYFIATTDSILQSIFAAMAQYLPSGGLFLPTGIDYIRFQPDVILAKINEAEKEFELSELDDSDVRREIMKEMRKSNDNAGQINQTEQKQETEEEKPKKECIFDVYCDPVTGILVTDGIEMRGIKASPAPRKSDTGNEASLESYQFIHDHEDPIDDEPLTSFKTQIESYVCSCDLMAIELLEKLYRTKQKSSPISNLVANQSAPRWQSKEDRNVMKKRFLNAIYSDYEKPEKVEGESSQVYKIESNGDRTLMSVLDQLTTRLESSGSNIVDEVLKENRLHLMTDLIKNCVTTERYIRPILETAVENICAKKLRLRLIEANEGDGLMIKDISEMVRKIEPKIGLDYSILHPNIKSIKQQKLLSSVDEENIKLYEPENMEKLMQESESEKFDLMVYKDISFYSLPESKVTKEQQLDISSLGNSVKVGGYLLVLTRSSLTLAERIVLALTNRPKEGLNDEFIESINRMNVEFKSHTEKTINEAKQRGLFLVSHKTDLNGCCILLFKRQMIPSECVAESSNQKDDISPNKYKLMRITHDNKDDIARWLEELKILFGKTDRKEQQDEVNNNQVVWLCAVATKQRPISGLIGMIQSLRKELGSDRLRCFYDCFTFKNIDEPVDIGKIEWSANFQEALRRNQIWNCIDSNGTWGSFRHFSIDDYISYENCLCDNLHEGSIKRQVYGAYVNIAKRGDLSSFTWYEAPFKYMDKENEASLVRVAYAAMNFRDIMLATGRLTLDAIPMSIAMSDCMLGLEFSGIDANGKRVMGMIAGRGIATHVVCPKETAVNIEVPESMSLQEAATIPICYATAIMALIYRGRIRRGESILIHAGSGGVGQAAIRIAAHFGLIIYTTVGSQEKREFLLQEFPNALSDDRIFSSRDCRFEDEIMRQTRGCGVDLVLNSLADDKLQASIACLADGGRFLEIGKYDMAVDTRLELLKLDTNKTFHSILLDKLYDDTQGLSESFKEQLMQVMETLKDGLKKGYVAPIKYKIYKKDKIEEAFRFMATGKHIGKVLVEIDNSLESISDSQRKLVHRQTVEMSCVPRFQLSSEKSYIVTGGLGGFGLELCKWLVKQGARYLVITSRTGPRDGYQRGCIRWIKSQYNAQVLMVDKETADTTTPQGAAHLCRLANAFAPGKQIGGLFHLAMVLKDTLLDNMTSDDFVEVCKPKLTTCEYLDKLLSDENLGYHLDYFIVFSSIVSGKGNGGQSNYAYANSYIERICELRREKGQHGLAIQWGAIGDVGAAYDTLKSNDIALGGLKFQRIPSCLAVLPKLICSPFHVTLSWVLADTGTTAAGGKVDLVRAIMNVLGIKDASKVSEEATLGDLGLDSLMAVEVRQYIEREYDKVLSVHEIRSLTISKIRQISDDASKLQSNEGATGEQGIPKDTIQFDDLAINTGAISIQSPKLKLPKEDFIILNKDNLDFNSNEKGEWNPIFFLPDLFGEFRLLKLVSQHIKIPCIGINWTERFAKAESMEDAVTRHLDLIKRFDWDNPTNCDFALNNDQVNLKTRRIHLVGYSFGATLGFEIMKKIHEQRLVCEDYPEPGHLYLLDGAPKILNLLTKVGHVMSEDKEVDESLNDIITTFVWSNSRKLALNCDFVRFKTQLLESKMDDKIRNAARWLVDMIQANSKSLSTETKNLKVDDIELAMVSYIGQFRKIEGYRCKSALPGGCTLIRASEFLLKQQDQNISEDYELSSIVEGKLDMHVVDGNHETFLANNSQKIASIITDYLEY